MTPTIDRTGLRRKAIAEAYTAAYREQENGADFLTALDTAMTGAGLGYVARPCECPADEDGTHLPECGWDYPS